MSQKFCFTEKGICYFYEQNLLFLTETLKTLHSFSVKFLLQNPAIIVSQAEILTITNICYCSISVMIISVLTEAELTVGSDRNPVFSY